MASPLESKSNALNSNFNVDYVICYRFATTNKLKAEAQFEKLIRSLADVGLAVEVRDGDDCSILIFVKIASEKHLLAEVYRSRVKDWLHGARTAAPDKETQHSLGAEPLTDAERLRIVYDLIASPKSEGGVGITPKKGEWANVESIFPLHDHVFNKEWLKKWASSYYIGQDDLTNIRNKFGEKVAFYFAFLQAYFAFLIFPAAFGFSANYLLPHFSPVYGVCMCLWSVVFIEYWRRQEHDLAVGWGVLRVSSIQHPRPEFQYEKEVKDLATGEMVKYFPPKKRIVRQLLQIPFAALALIMLGSLIATCFGIEVFISEVYNGPFKSVLVFLPTVLLTVFIPVLSGVLTQIASRLTEFENYATVDEHEAAMTRKVFVFNFITGYFPLFLTAFVYVPFGSLIVPYLDILNVTVKPFANHEKETIAPKVGFQINPDRLRKQVFYFSVTAQIVSLLLEVIVPYLKRKGFAKVKKMKTKRATMKGGDKPDVSLNDPPEEASFLTRVRSEAELDIYDVNADLREMTLQFGYLNLFSVVWPLMGASYLINDWIELRSDAIKICVEMQRPIPLRSDTIGPWLDNLGFLAWLGSITTAALVYLFSGDGLGPEGTPWNIKAWGLLLTIFFCEHIYLLVRWGVRTAMESLESPGKRKERAERFLVRKHYLDESFQQEATSLSQSKSGGVGGSLGEKVTRQSLEEEARQGSLRGSKVEDLFWGRQRSAEESITVGKGIIARSAPKEGKKDK